MHLQNHGHVISLMSSSNQNDKVLNQYKSMSKLLSKEKILANLLYMYITLFYFWNA